MKSLLYYRLRVRTLNNIKPLPQQIQRYSTYLYWRAYDSLHQTRENYVVERENGAFRKDQTYENRYKMKSLTLRTESTRDPSVTEDDLVNSFCKGFEGFAKGAWRNVGFE